MLKLQIWQSSSLKILWGWVKKKSKIDSAQISLFTISTFEPFSHSTSQYCNPDQGLDQVLTLIFNLVTSLVPYVVCSITQWLQKIWRLSLFVLILLLAFFLAALKSVSVFYDSIYVDVTSLY